MLDRETQIRILAIKRGGIDGLRKYMSKICDCPIAQYTPFCIYNILKNIIDEILQGNYEHIASQMLFDFNESLRLEQLKDNLTYSFYVMLNECICTVISQIQVHKNGYCINGFTEEALENAERILKEMNIIDEN